MSLLLHTVLKRITAQHKLHHLETSQTDYLFIYFIALMFENNFFPLDNGNVVNNIMESIDLELLSKWKFKGDKYELKVVISGYKIIPVKLYMTSLGAAVLIVMTLQDAEKPEPYSVCMPINHYINISEDTESVYINIEALEYTLKNNLLSPVKSKIFSLCGFCSASLHGLPDELFMKVMLYLYVKDILNVSKTCKRCNELIYNDALWHLLFKRDFNNTDTPTGIGPNNWNQLYITNYYKRHNVVRRPFFRDSVRSISINYGHQ